MAEEPQAHSLISHFITAFLLAELKQDAAAAAVLALESAVFLQIVYEAEGISQRNNTPEQYFRTYTAIPPKRYAKGRLSNWPEARILAQQGEEHVE